MKKILITVSNGWGIKNYLHSGLIDRLASSAEVLIFTTEELSAFFFNYKENKECKFQVKILPQKENNSWFIFRKIRKVAFQLSIESETARIICCNKVNYYWTRIFINFFWKKGGRHLGNFIFQFTSAVEILLKRWSWNTFKIDKAELALIGFPFDAREIQFQWICNKYGIETVTVIPSWDNLSSKGVLPDTNGYYFVWGQAQKKELLKYYKKKKSDYVCVVGLPQFDPYLNLLRSKKEKSIILFATGNKKLCPHEPDLALALAKMVQSGTFGINLRLVVRLHPFDNLSRYSKLHSFDRTVLQLPDQSATDGADKWIPPEEESQKLSEILSLSYLCINTASTMTLDALALGVPVINIAYDNTKDYYKSCRRFYDYDHFRLIPNFNGVIKVRNEFELMEAIKLLINDTNVGKIGGEISNICDLDPLGPCNQKTSVEKYIFSINAIMQKNQKFLRMAELNKQ